MLVADVKFWRFELEEPALLLLSSIKKMPHLLEGDAMIQQFSTSTSGGGAGSNTTITGTLEAPDFRAQNQKDPLKRKRQDDKQHKYQHNVSAGLYKTNRSGKTLCEDFNGGSCEAAFGDHQCPRRPHQVHQCNKCLATNHSGNTCQKTPKGKGKGKKGGKDGKRR